MQSIPPRHSCISQIELVTFIVILGTLAAFALPSLCRIEEQARRVSMQTVASTLTFASIQNWGLGQLRGEAQPVTRCADALRFLINVQSIGSKFQWLGREAELVDIDLPSAAPYRQCALRVTNESDSEEVRFFIHGCTHRHCG